MIVTQTPVRPRKHEGFDRTGDFCSRIKMNQDLAQVINDGLGYYEDHLDEEEGDHETWIKPKNINLISQAEFDKLKSEEGSGSFSGSKKVTAPGSTLPPPPPPPLNTPYTANGGFLDPENFNTSKAGGRYKSSSHFYPVTKEPTTPGQDVPRKRKTRHSQNPPVEMHVGWILDSRPVPEGGRGRSDSFSDSQSLGSSYGTPQSLPAFQHPSHALLKENQFTQLQYSKYHSRCLKGNDFFNI